MTYRAWFDRASSTKSQITHRGGITRASRCTLQYEIMRLVARNCKCSKGLNNVPCVVRSCIKYGIANHAPRWNHSCIKHEIANHAPRWHHSCIKMHATIWNNAPCSVQLVARNRRKDDWRNYIETKVVTRCGGSWTHNTAIARWLTISLHNALLCTTLYTT